MKSKEIANIDFFALVEEELRENGHVRFRVKGTSMQPILRNGKDEVKLTRRGDRIPTPGDICLFRFHGQHILHRCVAVENGEFYMQGDNILDHREHCPLDGILGIVETVYRDGKPVDPRSCIWKIRTQLHHAKYRLRGLLSRIWHLFD